MQTVSIDREMYLVLMIFVHHVRNANSLESIVNLQHTSFRENVRTIELALPSHVPHKPNSESKWRAELRINGKTVHLGYFNEDDEEAAARAYDEAARKEGKPTNFTSDGPPGDAVKRQPAARQSVFKGVCWDTR